MKTAMQEHIEHLKIMQNMVKEKSLDSELTETINETLAGAIENAESFLKKEKQQIIDAYNSGQQIPPFVFDQAYFNKTFKKMPYKEEKP